MPIKKVQIFTGENKALAAHLFYIPQEGQTNALTSQLLDVIFPGLPHTPCFHEIESFVTESRAILYVHYYGSWFSGEEFTPENSSRTLQDILIMLKSKTTRDIYTDEEIVLNPIDITLIGNSFGGFFVYQEDFPYKRVLLSPLLAVNPVDVSLESSKKVLSKVARGIIAYKASLPYVYRGIANSTWEMFINNAQSQELVVREPIDIFIGENDSLITSDYVKDSLQNKCEARIVVCPCGHNFNELYKSYVESNS